MNLLAIIQARTGSTRLPGKVLADVGGRSMLCRVCDRAGQATLVDRIVVATTREPRDNQIVEECNRLNVACVRGSTEDVLKRYDRAAGTYAADAVVRITADCPLIDPGVIDLVVGAFLEQRPDYAANILKRTWPRGLDTEVMTAAALRRACREATEPYQRAHVTPYIYQHPESFRLLAVTGPQHLGRCRWTVDWPEDLEFIRAVYRRFDGRETFSWRDVRRLLAREPALAELNRHVRQKQLAEG